MKKIFSLIIVVAAVAMVSCGGNANKTAAAAEGEAAETEVVAEGCCGGCAEQADSTKECCGCCAEADSTKECCGNCEAEK